MTQLLIVPGGGGGGGVSPPFPISYTTGLQTALDGLAAEDVSLQAQIDAQANTAFFPLTMGAIGTVVPDFADGRNFILALNDGDYPRFAQPLNVSEGQLFSIIIDATAATNPLLILWGGGYVNATGSAGIQELPPDATPGFKTLLTFQILDDGSASLLQYNPMISPVVGSASGQYVIVTVASVDGNNLGETAMFSEVKFTVGGSPIPANMTSNNSGGVSIYNATDYGVFDQTGNVYYASDGNPATGFGEYQANIGAWQIGFDFGSPVSLTALSITVPVNGLFEVFVSTSNVDLSDAQQAMPSSIHAVISTVATVATVIPK